MIVGIKREKTPKKLKLFYEGHVVLGVFEKGKLINNGYLFSIEELYGIMRFTKVSRECEFDLFVTGDSARTDYLKVAGVDDV
jgi:hypothetical protein